MFDNLDFSFVAFLHYATMAMALIVSAALLRQRRGNSLLAISVVTLSLQVGLYYGFLPSYVAQGPGRVFEPAFTRLGVALILYYCISVAFMLASLSVWPREPEIQYSKPTLRHAVVVGSIFLAAAFIVFRIRSGAAALVLSEGTDVLGGAAYYDLRAELIDVQTEGYSRLSSHFEHLSRKFLFLFLIVASYFFGVYRQAQSLALIVVLSGTLLFDEFIRFQKAPIMFVLGGAILPAIMFWAKDGRQNWRTKLPRWVVGGAILFGLAGWIAVITMGVPIEEVVEFVKARFFQIPPYTSSMYFYVYPETNPFVEFSTVRVVSTILGLPQMTYSGAISVDVAEAISGLRYNANACMVADGWANWGYAGVIGVTCAASGAFLAIDHYMRVLRRFVDVTPLTLFFWTCLVSFGNTAFLNIVVSNALWFVPFVYPFVFWQSASPTSAEMEGAAGISPDVEAAEDGGGVAPASQALGS